jgi:predicted AlkP superfamily phosphohydrolase/phosphomutase
LWRFTDAKDPYYPGSNHFENVIKDFYLIFDDIIGKFISSLDKDAALLVISDHGHRGRPPNCLNLNEFLRRKGYITINDKNIFGIFRKLLEKIKVFTISAMSKCAMEDYLYKLAKLIPNRKVLKKSTYLIDKSRSSVSLSGLCGTSPLGGINISADSKEEYESIRDNLIKDLKQINITLGSDVVKQVMKREQVYKGKCESVLPDIFFELDTNYGVGMNFFVPLVSKDYGHRKISGGHKKEAVFLVCGDKTINNFARPSSIIGIKDYIAEIIGC